MANPKGNPGNKGGGRKSAYKEMKAADFAKDLFFKPQQINKLRKKLESGKYSASDIMAAKILLEKNDRLLHDVFTKLVPDQIEDVTGPKTIIIGRGGFVPGATDPLAKDNTE